MRLSESSRLQRFMLALFMIAAMLFCWTGWASAHSSPSVNLFIGPSPVIVHPAPVIVEGYPVHHYHHYHHHGGPPPWSAAWHKHDKKHWKHHWESHRGHWHHRDW